MRVVLDTCVLKLATLPGETNFAALIVDLVLRDRLHVFTSPAMLDEYGTVLANAPEFLAAISAKCDVCHPLTPLRLIRHEPDNRFLECALSVEAEYLITVNTAPGHFDRPTFGAVRITTPGRFVRLPEIQVLLRALM